MFYETDANDHGLPHDPFKSCIVPRPIAWVSTLSTDGVVNLAPFSFFNGAASDPPQVLFCINGNQPHGGIKDTLRNCEETGEFVVNMATWDLRDQMNTSCAAVGPEVDEMELAGLESLPSRLVKPPRVKASPIHMECLYQQTVDLPSTIPNQRNALVLGRVIGIHIDDSVLTDGIVDLRKIRPIGRLGYMDYAVVDDIFSMARPRV
ncbi:MAG: flavin reductase family protein [Hyphomicrobiales bacterium]|nr:flavin reductase family protein [Hyphomicrobiales bacterium]